MRAKHSPALGLTVRALIERLRRIEGDTLVVLEADNGGFVGLSSVEALGLKLFSNADPAFGPHEAPHTPEAADQPAAVLRG